MTEFIINSDQLERIIEAVEHNTSREVNRVIIDGERIPVIVRCRDCAEADSESEPGSLHCMVNEWRRVEPDDYCSLGERREG